MELSWIAIDRIIAGALVEDVGTGDVTTAWTVPGTAVARAEIVAKEEGVIAGLPVAERVFRAVDPEVTWIPYLDDGECGNLGAVIAEIRGSARGILTAERTALNFLQRLSGTATMTARCVETVRGTGARITDTRKTTPGLRELEKYAVRVGGGVNHRFGLYDMVLIKENHIVVAGGIAEAVRRVREGMTRGQGDKGTRRQGDKGTGRERAGEQGSRRVVGVSGGDSEEGTGGRGTGGQGHRSTLDARRSTLKIEVETTTLDEVRESLSVGVDRIMLDNMTIEAMRKAVEIIRTFGGDRTPEIEVSGGVTIENLRQIAETGVDFISIGALTHSVKALDLSLLFRV